LLYLLQKDIKRFYSSIIYLSFGFNQNHTLIIIMTGIKLFINTDSLILNPKTLFYYASTLVCDHL